MSQHDDLTNVLQLYEELGVRPDEGVERLTARYRARLRELHPDRRGSGTTPPGDLAWLTRSYREAVAFQRRFGRLPGASQRPSGGAGPADGPGAHGGAPMVVPRPRRGGRAPGPSRWRWPLAAGAMTALLLVIAYEAPQTWRPPSQGERAARDDAAGDATQPVRRRVLPPLETVRLGATPREVLRIQGPPMRREGARWHYGVSWIDFEDGRVADWHSAESRPLRVERPDGS